MNQRDPADFEETWAALAPQFAGAEPDPTQSLRSSETLGEGEDPGVDLVKLPLLSVADTGETELTTQKLLGKGGMGKVELAIQHSLRREVAVKSTLGDSHGSKANALLQEALVTGLLEHPNIVPVHQLGRSSDDLPLLVMKRVEGVSWEALIRDPEHPHWRSLGEDRLQEHISILLSVCNAVEFAHARGILHRDIKPANVMVGAFGEVYLLDWGLAMRLDPRPESDAVVGTPSQMAPEMLNGNAELDARTDVYLLGASLHTALTGKPRHSGTTLVNTVYAIHVSAPVSYPPEVPSELTELCNRSTHVDPAQRPASAAAFRRELERYLEHRSSIALTTETSAKLAALRELLAGEEPDRERLAALSAECRFGFGQALRGWPENTAAQDGLQECLTLLIERELDQRKVSLAEALFSELPLPAPQLEARVSALRREQDAREARLRDMESQGDWRQGAAARLAFFIAMLLVGVALWMWANKGNVRYQHTLTPGELARSASTVLLALCVMLFFGRKLLLTSKVNTHLVFGALLTGAAIVLNRLTNCVPAPPTASLISSEVVFCAYGTAMGALLLARWLWLPVPIFVAGAFAARLIPSYAGLCFAISSLIALSVGAWKLHTQTAKSP